MIDTLIEEYPDAPPHKYEKVLSAVKQMQKKPYMYEEYHRHKPDRRFMIEDYLVYYKIDEETVDIYRVLYYRKNIELL